MYFHQGMYDLFLNYEVPYLLWKLFLLRRHLVSISAQFIKSFNRRRGDSEEYESEESFATDSLEVREHTTNLFVV